MSGESFGQLLKAEREKCGLALGAVADALDADPETLLALERNDFGALPDEAAMARYLHAYAECLDVDAELMIADYDRERAKYLAQLDRESGRRLAASVAGVGSVEARRRALGGRWLFLLVLLAMASVAVWWLLGRSDAGPPREVTATADSRTRRGAPEEPAEAAPASETGRVLSESVSSTAPGDTEVEPTLESAGAESEELAAAVLPAGAPAVVEEPRRAADRSSVDGPRSRLSVPDYGVGTGLENRELVGRGASFREGTRVWFWTRVRGGAEGDRIEHVWLRDGVELWRTSLPVGSPSWRTHSVSTLRSGSAGAWAVEARDEAGRVLARSDFVCER